MRMPRRQGIIPPNLGDLKTEFVEHRIKVIEIQELDRFYMMMRFILIIELNRLVDPAFTNSPVNLEFDTFL